jgi:hypothetical protein
MMQSSDEQDSIDCLAAEADAGNFLVEARMRSRSTLIWCQENSRMVAMSDLFPNDV